MPGEVLATVVVSPRERFSTALRCLPNLIKNTKMPHRLVYVAGGAPDYVRSFLTQTCCEQDCELVLEPEYLSPNIARNIGLRRVKTKYAVFLDNDVVVEPGWLEALVRCAEETGADVVGPLCLFGEPEKGIIHDAGGDLNFHEESGRRRMEEKHRHANVCLKTKSMELKRSPCDFVEFHCMLTRRDLFDRIGFMDEKIFSAGEHMDLALHVRECGGKTYTEPAAVVSYLTDAEYLISDADFFRIRWCNDWNERTMAHFAEKWKLDRHSTFFKDYESFIERQQEICSLPRPVFEAVGDIHPDRHPFAQTNIQLLNQMTAAGYPAWDIATVRQACDFAAILFAGVYRESGKTLEAHVMGTASVLATFGAPVTAIVAGLLHPAYAFGRFKDHAEDDLDAQRRLVVGKMGWRVEALLYELTRLDYPTSHYEVMESDFDRLRLNLAYAILMRIANSIDEHLDFGLLHAQNPSERIEKNRIQNEQWEPIYRKVAARLGCEGMLDLLHRLHVDTRNRPSIPVQHARPEGSYILDPKSSAPAPLNPRKLTHSSVSLSVQKPAKTAAPETAEPLLSRLRNMKLGKIINQIDLKKVSSQNQGVVRLESSFPKNVFLGSSLIIETDSRQWCYSAAVNVKPSETAKGPAVLRVRLKIKQGEMGVGLMRKGSSTEYIVPEQSQDHCNDPIDLLFSISDLREVGDLIFRNHAALGKVTVAKIYTLSLHLPE